MYTEDIASLPIAQVLTRLREGFAAGDELVLQAPPGAGKTTIVPLEMLRESWLAGQRILVLEPRRVAARAAAGRMASLLGEVPGNTVGYRIRLESRVSDSTRVEVVTEGILTRRLQRDPALEGVGLVIFDEFHERSLDSDLGLALTLQARATFREGLPLKVLVMSATLDGEAVARLLGDAPVVTSRGRQFPVDLIYGGPRRLADSVVPVTVSAIERALREVDGNLLVFLPGQREINRVARALKPVAETIKETPLLVAPLYGGLSLKRQQQAIDPAPAGVRKVVLATNIAETSLTIEGIAVVIDSGLVREPVFDAATGMTRLALRRISRASAEQRQGRAGRLGPGSCYRLWSEEQQGQLVAHATPEILQADLAPLALQLLAWGVTEPAELDWLDAPPGGPYAQALGLLESLGAAFSNDKGVSQLTPHGVRLAQIPLHPRLGHMMLVGCDIHASETAGLLAALLSERNPLYSLGVDVGRSLKVLMGETDCPPEHQSWFKRTWQQARRFAQVSAEVHKPRRFAISVSPDDVLGVLLASAWPDRIARVRDGGDGTAYQLSNGRSATLPEDDDLRGREWLAVAEVGGEQGGVSDRIYSASALNPANFGEILSTLVREEEHVEWDYRNEKFVAERRLQVGQIRLRVEPLSEVSDVARRRALVGVVRRKGLDVLTWDPKLDQWRARVNLLYELENRSAGDPAAGDPAAGDPAAGDPAAGDPAAGGPVAGDPAAGGPAAGGPAAGASTSRWPDLTDEALLASLEDWLLPYVSEVRSLQDFKALDVRVILHTMLPWPLPLELERLAPERMAVPSGSSIAIDYCRQPPVLAVKLQEMFGCQDTPQIADGRVALQVHLLSPAGRPLQVTQDLAGFWRGAYREVQKEMKGRYPKHPWPDDPLRATPTRHTSKRSGAMRH